jgi:hypothetical protein
MVSQAKIEANRRNERRPRGSARFALICRVGGDRAVPGDGLRAHQRQRIGFAANFDHVTECHSLDEVRHVALTWPQTSTMSQIVTVLGEVPYAGLISLRTFTMSHNVTVLTQCFSPGFFRGRLLRSHRLSQFLTKCFRRASGAANLDDVTEFHVSAPGVSQPPGSGIVDLRLRYHGRLRESPLRPEAPRRPGGNLGPGLCAPVDPPKAGSKNAWEVSFCLTFHGPRRDPEASGITRQVVARGADGEWK